MPSSSFVEKYPDFVLKLKIKAADGQTQIRRVRLPRIADGEGKVSYEELVGLVVIFSVPEELAFDSSRYNVSLTYYDVDGDSVTIASSEELMDACEQYVGQQALRITTYVKPNTTVVPATAAATTFDTKPTTSSVDRGTSTAPSPPIQIHDVLESFVGVLSTAVNHLQEGLAAKNNKSSMTSVPRSDSVETTEQSVCVTSEETGSSNENEDSKAHEEDTKPAAELSSEEEEVRPFIHGRHTCDSCLSTPIIGTRYHSTNLKDYDLCENCHGNYKGKEIVFEPAELDRDRACQDRWYQRWENARGLRRGRLGRGLGPRGRFGRHGMKPGRPGCSSGSQARPLQHHVSGSPSSPSMTGRPLHGPTVSSCPYMGSGGLHNPHRWAHLGPHAAPHIAPHVQCQADGISSEFDNALKEAIRRSLKDVAPKEDKINGLQEEKSNTSVEILEVPNVEEHVKAEADVSSASIDMEDGATDIPRSIVVDQSKSDNSLIVEDECVEQTEAMEKSMYETESVDSEKLAPECNFTVASTSPCKTPTSIRKICETSKDESFASDAKGNGDVAEAMGAALDAVVDVIREMQAESRHSHSTTDEEAGNEGGDLVIDSTELIQKDCKECDSDWSVVKSVGSNGTTESEQIAKAAEMLGSALFNSDMKTPTETFGAEQGSSLSVSAAESSFSVPSSVPTDFGTQKTSIAAQAQLERWSAHLLQLRELGFDNEPECVEVLERLQAANIGVDGDDDVSINHVVNELLEEKY
ncbi:zinc finger ZZ type domain containing protein [Nitzschia inconspicua]|uniref:Zinc finger ZZ type domain containing protein n=1 Tax=Nitzschia inconspicua TaxID=303405 RepID=A0A9K3Q1Q3_9STRA|nr:zinc finger ZZ type domain containing protein [Nitzschia inconspicua]